MSWRPSAVAQHEAVCHAGTCLRRSEEDRQAILVETVNIMKNDPRKMSISYTQFSRVLLQAGTEGFTEACID